MQRMSCHFSGRVQGVGFRYTVHNLAMRCNVTGYVRNLPDGRVEMVVEGFEQELDSLLADVRQRMEGFVRNVHVERSPATGEFRGFVIRH